MTKTAAGIIAAVVGGIALIAFLAGGGGANKAASALDPVAQAADTTTGAGSVEFGIAGNITAAGRTVPLNGSGTMDMRSFKARMTLSTSLPGVGSSSIEEIMNGPTFYMRMPQLAQRLPGGKQWIKVDLQALGKARGIDFAKALSNSPAQSNPADMLGYLKAVGNSRVVGHEGIRGADTTHYSASIDVQKATDRLGDRQTASALGQLYRSSGLRSIPVDVWVDRSGRVRRESLSMTMNPGGGAPTSLQLTIEYIRFGVPVDASPPPADQVMDVSSQVGAGG